MQLQSAVTSMASGLYRGLALPLRSDAMGPRERLQVRVHSRAGRAFVGPTLVHGTLSSPRYFTTINALELAHKLLYNGLSTSRQNHKKPDRLV